MGIVIPFDREERNRRRQQLSGERVSAPARSARPESPPPRPILSRKQLVEIAAEKIVAAQILDGSRSPFHNVGGADAGVEEEVLQEYDEAMSALSAKEQESAWDIAQKELDEEF